LITAALAFIFLAEAGMHHAHGPSKTPYLWILAMPFLLGLGPLGLPVFFTCSFQFVIYGILLGLANQKGEFSKRLKWIAVAHALMAGFTFWLYKM
jgi:hypothetical protein